MMPTSSKYRRRLGPPSIAGVLVAASLAIGGCGSGDSAATDGTDSAAILDTGKIERAIADSSLAQRGLHADVSCPSDVPQKQGMKFSCTATVGQVDTEFVVVQTDDAGHVHYEAP
jgi:hypothetical protein